MQLHHNAGEEDESTGEGVSGPPQSDLSKWRQKERLKTSAVALVLCLNIGVDPPDVIKISPCARQECWTDPLSMQPPKALEQIGAQASSVGSNAGNAALDARADQPALRSALWHVFITAALQSSCSLQGLAGMAGNTQALP